MPQSTEARHLYGGPVSGETKYPVRTDKPSTSKLYSAMSVFPSLPTGGRKENSSAVKWVWETIKIKQMSFLLPLRALNMGNMGL